MTGRSLVGAIVLAALVGAPAARAQETPAIVGVWTLNREKSQLPRAPDGALNVRQYTLRPDGYLVGLLVTADARGYHYLQFTAKSDGKDYPEYTDDLLASVIAAGTQTTRSYSEKAIDELTTEWTDKVNGRVTASGRKTVSTDRKTLTITVNGSSQVYVYDRR